MSPVDVKEAFVSQWNEFRTLGAKILLSKARFEIWGTIIDFIAES